ncbi:MAG TPA: hypothetical protein V6D20_05320 [Candidatus Obscuribacterales bacterium]
MAISFTPITFKNTIDGGLNLDTNFSRIQTALTGALSRTSSTNNEMGVELDMNSNKIINLAEPTSAGDAARLADVQAAISGSTSANLVSFTPYDFISSSNVQGAVQEIVDKLVTPSVPVLVPKSTVSALPSATTYDGGIIIVTDEVGGEVLAFSDGTNWLRTTDRAIVSV